MFYGLVGVTAFSLTLPATRVAVAAFDPLTVSLGRVMLAALLAAGYLLVRRRPLPPRSLWPGLAVVAAGSVLGFPFLLAWALRWVDASHGAIVLGLLPLATAGAGALRAGERPSPGFWLASLVGSGLVVAFAAREGAGRLQPADLLLLGAVVAAGLGYAEGGRLTRVLGGLEVISWALVLSAPVLAVAAAVTWGRLKVGAPAQGWIALGYLALVSQFLGFVPWYRGLALGGIARVSQVQLLQPFLTLLASALWLGEALDPVTFLYALGVMATVALGRRAGVAAPRAAGPAPTRVSLPGRQEVPAAPEKRGG